MSPSGLLRRVAALAVAAVVLLAAGSALADKRVALVIGNARYANTAPLANPGNDARLIAQTLKGVGFTLVGGGAQLDLDKPGFDRAVRNFGQALQGADIALFYYGGHGMQVAGTNWLVPVDARLGRPQDLEFVMVDAGAVLRQMEGAGTRLNVVLLDACRDNPFIPAAGRGVGRGLAQMQAPEGTLISYATQPGAEAEDGSGRDSPYSTALANAMRQPGLDLFQMFNRVGVEVKRATGGRQLPWVSNSPIEGQFYFAGTGAGEHGLSAGPSPPAPAAGDGVATAGRQAPPPQPHPPPPQQLAVAQPPRPQPMAPTETPTAASMTKAAKCSVGRYAFTRNSANSFAPVAMVTSADGWCWIEPINPKDGTGYAAELKTPPSHGQAALVTGNSGGNMLSYRPASGYVGPDHLQFVVYPVAVILDFTVDVQPAP